MAHILRLILGVVLLLTTTATGPLSAQVPLEFMTFNIRTSMGRDGKNAWEHRKDLVAETILREAPVVVGLQEALADQLEDLGRALPEYRWLGVDRGLNGGVGLSEATPIFYRHAELVPIKSGTFWLSDTPDGPQPGQRAARIVTWAQFHHIESGLRFHVYNTHLSVRRDARQAGAAAMIAARVAELPPGSMVIVMGDFNAVAGASDTWIEATSPDLLDAWIVAEERLGPSVTWSGFGPPRVGAEDRIDWILVGGPIRVRSAETVLHNRDGHYPSDHYPVVARLLLDGPEAGETRQAQSRTSPPE